jgi:hypothetical protein
MSLYFLQGYVGKPRKRKDSQRKGQEPNLETPETKQQSQSLFA